VPFLGKTVSINTWLQPGPALGQGAGDVEKIRSNILKKIFEVKGKKNIFVEFHKKNLNCALYPKN
jgi:hypothetical protein